jgi:hypothetical protein
MLTSGAERLPGGAQTCGLAALQHHPKRNRKDAKNAKLREAPRSSSKDMSQKFNAHIFANLRVLCAFAVSLSFLLSLKVRKREKKTIDARQVLTKCVSQ